jgi:penicillin-binding protein 1A
MATGSTSRYRRHYNSGYTQKQHATQTALLAMRPSGAIVSMVGGIDYNGSQYNRATLAKRQSGSAFKTFVYLTAMEKGYSPDMVMVDAPISVGKWQPKNYKNEYKGQVTLTSAFAQSLNTIAVKLSQYVGLETIRNTAKRLGVKSPMSAVPALALGAMDVTLKEMVVAYAHLANGGKAVTPYGIIAIHRKRDHHQLYMRSERDDFSDITVIGSGNVAKMNRLLQAVITSGTGRAAAIGRPAAGKTGTTSSYRDAWFIGYTPDIVAGIWVGNDDNTPMYNVTGGSLPARIWHGFMQPAHAALPVKELPTYYAEAAPTLPWQQQGTDNHDAAAPIEGVAPSVPAPNPAPSQDYKLEKSFWDTLFDEKNVEYDYPSQQRR